MSQTLPDPDYDDPKETFAFFGLAFYYAQVLERGIVNLAVALNAKGVPGVTFGDVKSLYESMDEKTFGQVLRSAQKVMDETKGSGVFSGTGNLDPLFRRGS